MTTPLVACARCARPSRTRRRWPEGLVCRTCIRHGAQRRGRCVGCGVDRLLPGLDAERHPICVDCAGIPCSFMCSTCGTEAQQWFGSTCLVCSLRLRLEQVLDDGSGHVARALKPLMASLVAMEHPWSGLIWLSRGTVAANLEALARGTVTIDHAGVDALPAGKTAEYLRELLMVAGVLERRDRHLMSFERWSARWLSAIDDPDHARSLRAYVLWRHHRDLSARAHHGPVSYSSVATARARANAGLRWLQWLAENDATLTTVTQADLDRWLATASNPRAADDFIIWSTRHRPPLHLPTASKGASTAASEPERREVLERLLTDGTINLRQRVAGCLVLAMAQPVNRICQLTLADIEEHDGTIFLRLGPDPVPLPTTVATLLTELLGTRSNMATAGNPDSDWLFPGKSPGNHLGERALCHQLAKLGVTRPGRQAALRQLIGTLPAPLVATAFGYNPNTVAKRAGELGTDWAGYASLKAREVANR